MGRFWRHIWPPEKAGIQRDCLVQSLPCARLVYVLIRRNLRRFEVLADAGRAPSFIVPPSFGADLSCRANQAQVYRTAADRAVFDIFLLGDTAIDQDFDGFSTIGTVYVQGFEWVHWKKTKVQASKKIIQNSKA